MIKQPLSNSSWQIYINRSEHLFYDLLKMSSKTKKLHIILLRLLRKIEQSRRLSNHLSFYRLWICMCWCKSDFSWTSEIFSGIFFCWSRFRKSCFQCGKIYVIKKYLNIYFTFIKFCLYYCVWWWNSIRECQNCDLEISNVKIFRFSTKDLSMNFQSWSFTYSLKS